MKLITYRDAGTLRTLMVEAFCDSYNTAGGWMVKYGVGDHKIEIPEAAIISEIQLDPHWHVTRHGMVRKL